MGSRGSCTGGYCENEKSHDPSSPSPSSSGRADDIVVSIAYTKHVYIHVYNNSNRTITLTGKEFSRDYDIIQQFLESVDASLSKNILVEKSLADWLLYTIG